ncbi:DUF1289 domain-containing protein [Pseudomaricurvus sp. HS19]|uniref:DUF1289 domain-containing protein n=1 Tax=Pseudomaricurvus sp. HS19 TaxID=2692626 RepID=UPI00136F085A|nr:DUF1289 domain-containing protein [Pseudomaricurvus sp. HS19]MYM62537.1 DUF1289 domain-containing protein [Pseudomaricurvus sp. HS19]
MAVFERVKTPCVGICSTGIGDQVCRGCKRFAHEVIHWNGYTQEQKRLIARRLEGFLVQVVSNKLQIVDRGQLLASMRHQQIGFREEQDPYCWVFDLLKAGASQIQDLSVYGLAYQRQWQGVPLAQIKAEIDQDFYVLSSAHYDRYFSMVPEDDA